MANYKNIQPYAEFAHEAAMHGGVDSFLSEIAASNYNLGILAEQSTEIWKIGIAVVTTICVFGGFQTFYHAYKVIMEESRKEEVRKAAEAKKNLINGMNNEHDDNEDE